MVGATTYDIQYRHHYTGYMDFTCPKYMLNLNLYVSTSIPDTYLSLHWIIYTLPKYTTKVHGRTLLSCVPSKSASFFNC